jgi:spermidine/putrescine-binding protein
VQDLIGMTMLRNGVEDPNSERPSDLAEAKDSLLDMVDAVAPSIDSTDYHDLFTGSAHVHQSWSGNMSYARHYAPQPDDIKTLSYYWPPEGHTGTPGLTGNDTLVILSNAQNPVLAHLFMNFTLDGDWAYENSVYNGYQSPVKQVTSERLVANNDVPENLQNIIVTQENFTLGHEELELSPSADVAWHEAYTEVQQAARRASAPV